MKIFASSIGPQGWGSYEVEINSDGVILNQSSQKPDYVLVPGFVDLHIHGAFGKDFMTSSTEEMISLADQLEAEGYETFLPTTVTASFDEIKRAISKLPDHPTIGGFHLEGPFLSPKYPGAQPPEAIAPIPKGLSDWDIVLDHSRLRLVTLAPEIENALDLVSRLSNRGVVVSAGHTDATYQQMESAIKCGLSHATHTFNAMRPFHHREAGTVGAVLNSTEINAELIYDRLHVAREATEILYKAKGSDKVVAVSDCTAAKGMARGSSLSMWGHDCVVGENSVRISSSGALAGSASTLLDVFRNLSSDFGPEVACKSCCINPRRILQMGKKPRKWLLFDPELALREVFSMPSL